MDGLVARMSLLLAELDDARDPARFFLHVLPGMNAHINFDLPLSLIHVIPLEGARGCRTPLDRVLAPANRHASRLFLREARRRCGRTPPPGCATCCGRARCAAWAAGEERTG